MVSIYSFAQDIPRLSTFLGEIDKEGDIELWVSPGFNQPRQAASVPLALQSQSSSHRDLE